MKNLIEEYIKFTEKNIKTYMKIIFAYKYDAQIVNEYITTYVNTRYYNINNSITSRPFYLKIQDEIEKKCELIKNENNDKEEIIEAIKEIFNYVLFWDNVRDINKVKKIKNIKETIDKIEEIRINKIKIKKQDDFKNTLYSKINEDNIKKEIFLDKFDNGKFYLEFEKNKENKNIYFSKLNYNIKMQREYSKEIIDEVFTTGLIAEDKLNVEYTLLSVVILKDIIQGNFKDTYISELPISLFKKKQKMNTLLSLIENQVVQDKLCLNINYEDFASYKKDIIELIRKGFKFSITLDNSLKNIEELEKLKIFKFIFTNKKLNLYKEIKKIKNEISNIIEK